MPAACSIGRGGGEAGALRAARRWAAHPPRNRMIRMQGRSKPHRNACRRPPARPLPAWRWVEIESRPRDDTWRSNLVHGGDRISPFLATAARACNGGSRLICLSSRESVRECAKCKSASTERTARQRSATPVPSVTSRDAGSGAGGPLPSDLRAIGGVASGASLRARHVKRVTPGACRRCPVVPLRARAERSRGARAGGGGARGSLNRTGGGGARGTAPTGLCPLVS